MVGTNETLPRVCLKSISGGSIVTLAEGRATYLNIINFKMYFTLSSFPHFVSPLCHVPRKLPCFHKCDLMVHIRSLFMSQIHVTNTWTQGGGKCTSRSKSRANWLPRLNVTWITGKLHLHHIHAFLKNKTKKKQQINLEQIVQTGNFSYQTFSAL